MLLLTPFSLIQYCTYFNIYHHFQRFKHLIQYVRQMGYFSPFPRQYWLSLWFSVTRACCPAFLWLMGSLETNFSEVAAEGKAGERLQSIVKKKKKEKSKEEFSSCHEFGVSIMEATKCEGTRKAKQFRINGESSWEEQKKKKKNRRWRVENLIERTLLVFFLVKLSISFALTQTAHPALSNLSSISRQRCSLTTQDCDNKQDLHI